MDAPFFALILAIVFGCCLFVGKWDRFGVEESKIFCSAKTLSPHLEH